MHDPISYHDTRGFVAEHPLFSEVVLRGIAPGGGLFVPDVVPELSLHDIEGLRERPYWRRAADIFTRFGVDVEESRIAQLLRLAYGDQWDDPRIAPVVEVVAGTHVLELWHGPTQAFKDMALQCMPYFFSEAVEMRRNAGLERYDYLILVATSGDTGKAALEGFADRDHTSIVVFYPADGVSDIQRKQMITQRGDNVCVFGVRGNFDECQASVKEAFNDDGFLAQLQQRHGLALSSANSINWGRLLPQVVYYASAYADLVSGGGLISGEPMDVCVPTGNFGNILGAYYAKRIGVPIERLLCASNENNVLTDFINTGVYDISQRDFVTTPSPSMDILISNNLERQLYEFTHDPSRIRDWMVELRDSGRFQVDRETYGAMRGLFAADFVTNDDCLTVIRRVWSQHGYLLDPHTAVAWEVAERLRGDNPVLVVSTAHWGKFGADVYRALRQIPSGQPLPEDVRSLGGVELLARIQKMAPEGACVPRALAELDTRSPRFEKVIDPGTVGVEHAVLDWLAR